MKIEKYNKWLLAVLGSIASAGLLLAIIGSTVNWVERRNRHSDFDDEPVGVVVELPVDTAKVKQRVQELDFEMPKLIDTANEIYVVPVSQVNLETPEPIAVENIYESVPYPDDIVLDGGISIDKMMSYGDEYNNLVVIQGDSATSVFTKKVYISAYHRIAIGKKIYLVLKACFNDSNKDNKLNEEDLQSACIYDLRSHNLIEVTFPEMDYSKFEMLSNQRVLILQFGIDKNKDGQFSSRREPSILKQYDFNTGKVSDFISKELQAELQKLIE